MSRHQALNSLRVGVKQLTRVSPRSTDIGLHKLAFLNGHTSLEPTQYFQTRTFFWSGNDDKADLQKKVAELQAENEEQLVAIGDLQSELQTVRSQVAAAEKAVKELEAQKKLSDIQKAEAVATAMDSYERVDSDLQVVRSLLTQINQLSSKGISAVQGQQPPQASQSPEPPAPAPAPSPAAPEASESPRERPEKKEREKEKDKDKLSKLPKTLEMGGTMFKGIHQLSKFCQDTLRAAAVGEAVKDSEARVLLALLRECHGAEPPPAAEGAEGAEVRVSQILADETLAFRLAAEANSSFKGLHLEVDEVPNEEDGNAGSRRSYFLVQSGGGGRGSQRLMFNFRRCLVNFKRKLLSAARAASREEKSALLQLAVGNARAASSPTAKRARRKAKVATKATA